MNHADCVDVSQRFCEVFDERPCRGDVQGAFQRQQGCEVNQSLGETKAGAPSSAAPMVSMGTIAEWAARDCIHASRQASGPDF